MWPNSMKTISCGGCSIVYSHSSAELNKNILDLHITALKNKTDGRKKDFKYFVNTSNVVVIGWLLHEDSNRKSAVDIYLAVCTIKIDCRKIAHDGHMNYTSIIAKLLKRKFLMNCGKCKPISS